MEHYSDLQSYISGEQERLELLKKSNIDFERGLEIEKLLVSRAERGDKGYSITSTVEELELDQHGIIGERHREASGFRERRRESHIYPKSVHIRQQRHLIAGTSEMASRISHLMNLESNIGPESLGWNLVFKRTDASPVYLDGLPIGTDFMIYPGDVREPEDTSRLIVNLKLVTQQDGCGITGVNIANITANKSDFKNFQEHSKNFRGTILVIDGPVGKHILHTKQKVFIRLPTGHMK